MPLSLQPPSQPPPSLPPPSLPPPATSALLLDLDGTLLDLAPTPDSVVVPPGLLRSLRRLRAGLGGALAVVSGRPVEQIDALLGDAPYAVAGEHGGAIRREPDAAFARPALPAMPAHWLDEAASIIAQHPGALLERKLRGLVFHYRGAPASGPALRQAALALTGPHSGRFQVLEASMAWEIRPRGTDKGVAVATLMREPPFAGRRPIFIGDDVTDEDGIRVAIELGGAGLRVAEAFGSPEAVRDWLRLGAEALDADAMAWPAL